MFAVEKLRPDWRIKTYVIPVSRIEANSEFWAEVRVLKDAWNEIVVVYRDFDSQITDLETELVKLRKEKLVETDTRIALNQIRRERKSKTIEAWKRQSASLFCNDLETLRIATDSAINLAYKNGGTLRFKTGIQSVNFAKRFKSGGKAFEDLFTELDTRDEKLRRKPLIFRVGKKRESMRSRNKTLLHGHYLVGKSRVPVKFTGVWSYSSFPKSSFVKKVTLVGKYSLLRNWQWRLILNVEEPPVEVISDQSLPIAALDLGYRRFAEYVRFGFIVDSAGNKFELRLPLGGMLSAYLKNTISFLKKKGIEKQYIKDLADYFDWDSAQGVALKRAKQQLKELSECALTQRIEMPEKWSQLISSLPKIRKRGLIRFKGTSEDLLGDENARTEKWKYFLQQAIEIIDKWFEQDVYFETEKEHFRRKFLGRRKLLYRQIVKWLASNYSGLIWKEDLNLKEIATETKQRSRLTNSALKESNKYRHWVSLHQLRLFIKEQSAKMSDWLRPGTTPPPWPRVCIECGSEIISDSSDLMLVCANDHVRDRDEQAAEKLLTSKLGETPRPATPVPVPSHLRQYIVPIERE